MKIAGGHDTFGAMLEKAIDDNPDGDILVKIHPDTLDGRRAGGKKSSKVYVFSSIDAMYQAKAAGRSQVMAIPESAAEVRADS